MIFEKLWEFSDAQDMVNATTAISDNIVDTTTSIYDEWDNMAVPLWIVVTHSALTATGTSISVKVYTHTTSTITSGDLLFTGPVQLTANMSANARNDGHYLLTLPVQAVMTAAGAMGGLKRYWGLVYTCAGDCSDLGTVDAYILATAHPILPTTQVTASNIT